MWKVEIVRVYKSSNLLYEHEDKVIFEVNSLVEASEINGFDEYVYVACTKGDVCPICKGLDDKHFKVDDMMPGENAPPMHPNCHCSTAAYMV